MAAVADRFTHSTLRLHHILKPPLGCNAHRLDVRMLLRSLNQKQNPTTRKTDTVMKTKHALISAIIAVTQSKWIRPALMTLALVAAVLGVTGCPSNHPH